MGGGKGMEKIHSKCRGKKNNRKLFPFGSPPKCSSHGCSLGEARCTESGIDLSDGHQFCSYGNNQKQMDSFL